MIRFLWIMFILLLATCSVVAGGEVDLSEPNQLSRSEVGADELLEMDLDSLVEIEVRAVASITESDPLKTPASVTVITAEDIARTPARNLLDLIEIYVPGALYLNHSVGPLPGIRGVIADRPYKFLVTVNGINVNIGVQYGARLELLNWDLNDIDRVEVVRGPGSVTYGPGAIGGVINIYTKTASSAEGVQYGGTYWSKYDSIGNYLSYGKKRGESELYAYLSVVRTEGVSPDLYGVGSSAYGYVGETAGLYSNLPAFTYMADYYEEPQIKSHFDLKINKNWRFWGRYNSESSALIQGSATQYLFDGRYQDFRQTRYRYYQFALENEQELDDDLSLKSTLAYGSKDVHNVEKFDSARTIHNDRDNLQNMGVIWSEDKLYNQYMLNYKPDEDIKAAMGVEFSYDTIGPGWGLDEDSGLLLGNGMISGPNSDMYGTGYRQITESSSSYYAIGDGWETISHAFLGELNYKVFERTTTIVSARLDRHEFTGYMFSPRLALIQELRDKEYLKFIAQRSNRMNTAEELYVGNEEGQENEPEKLDSLEMIYSGKFNKHATFQISAFYNQADVIAWDWASFRSANVGELKSWGLEAESRYEQDKYVIGLNHAFTKQLEWELADGVDVSGISYSDYYRQASSTVVIHSNGNDLNNWANQATKMFTNIYMFDKRVTLHGDLVTYWGFEGSMDGLEALEEAGGNVAAINDIYSHDVYDIESKANISLTFALNSNADLTLFAQNLPVVGDNKRYSYSSGFKNTYPDKVSWIEEPSVFGVQFKARF